MVLLFWLFSTQNDENTSQQTNWRMKKAVQIKLHSHVINVVCCRCLCVHFCGTTDDKPTMTSDWCVFLCVSVFFFRSLYVSKRQCVDIIFYFIVQTIHVILFGRNHPLNKTVSKKCTHFFTIDDCAYCNRVDAERQFTRH